MSNAPISAFNESASSSAVAAPLTPQERAAANDVAQRVRLDILALLELLPEQDRGASALARALKLDRNTCQRIVASTSRPDANAQTLVQLPGIAGLRQFVDAMATVLNGRGKDQLITARGAVDQFQRLLDDLAGSQRRLKERLDADIDFGEGEALGPADDLNARRALFRAAAEVTGRWSETWLTMSALRPNPKDPTMTEGLKIRGHIGHVSRAAAVPLEIGFVPYAKLRSDEAEAVNAKNPMGLLEQFCSDPIPSVTTRVINDRSIYVIEAAETAKRGSMGTDIVTGELSPRQDKHPAMGRPPVGEVWSLVTFPARRVMFEVFLHREIARRCVPSLELHLWSPQVMQLGFWRWSTRFPGGPKLEALGMGLDKIDNSAYARHRELAAHMFASAGWDPREFVGYRCDVMYPVWRAGYCMLFDFTGNEMH